MKPEMQLHTAVARFLSLTLRPPTTFTTIGHGGGGRVRGALLKTMGVKAGWPDILIADKQNGRLQLVGLELKSEKGRLSPEQKDVQRQFEAVGAIYGVCRSLDEVEGFLKGAGVRLYGATA